MARIHRRTPEEIISLGYRARHLLHEDGLSINRIAERFGVTYTAVTRWIDNADRHEKDQIKRS